MKQLMKVFTVMLIIIMLTATNFILVGSSFISYAMENQNNDKVKANMQVGLGKYVNYNLPENNKGVLLRAKCKDRNRI